MPLPFFCTSEAVDSFNIHGCTKGLGFELLKYSLGDRGIQEQAPDLGSAIELAALPDFGTGQVGCLQKALKGLPLAVVQLGLIDHDHFQGVI